MNIEIGRDVNDKGYVVYKVKLSDGSYLEVDADLADSYWKGYEEFVIKEVELAEQRIQEQK